MHIYSTIFAALLLLSPTLADFHIGQHDRVSAGPQGPISATLYLACPSNYYNCKCYGSIRPDRGVFTVGGQSPGSATFSLSAGLCGMGQLDFYYRQSKESWDFYVNGGDGSLQGTCYSNSDTQTCYSFYFSATYYDRLVCYSYICK
ncbi:hypothetical protein V8E54_006809 [Elaphomyces granulatus]|jgi:hypothetical protein